MLSNNNIHVLPISGIIVMHFGITGKFFKNILGYRMYELKIANEIQTLS